MLHALLSTYPEAKMAGDYTLIRLLIELEVTYKIVVTDKNRAVIRAQQDQEKGKIKVAGASLHNSNTTSKVHSKVASRVNSKPVSTFNSRPSSRDDAYPSRRSSTVLKQESKLKGQLISVNTGFTDKTVIVMNEPQNLSIVVEDDVDDAEKFIQEKARQEKS